MTRDFPIPYTIRSSSRAKRLRLVVKPAGVELVLPMNLSEAQGLDFLHRNRDWALGKFAEIRARQAPPPTAQPLAKSTSVPFQGRDTPLLIEEAKGREVRVRFEGHFVVALPAGSSEALLHAALFAWIKQWMREESGRIIRKHGQRHGLEPREIRVKRMTSRWGSCGARDDINLNWLLAFAPPAVLEYVVVHELCHIRHRDHSARFWDLVARHLPCYAEERQWLRRHGGELLRRFST